MLEIRYVWEIPVRVTHWINAFCIVVLSVTGYFIHHPYLSPAGTGAFVMGWVSFVHFACAYLFLVSVAARMVWFFLGNHHASWRMFFPWATQKGRNNAKRFFLYYIFIGKKIPYEIGHNPLASMAYAAVFSLFLLQIVSGFALYGQYQPGSFWNGVTAPLLTIFGNQGLRLTHHLTMWLLLAFVINHLYSAWLMDIKERNGTMSGIFGGYKYIEPKDL